MSKTTMYFIGALAIGYAMASTLSTLPLLSTASNLGANYALGNGFSTAAVS
jgi:hypothetical protein